MKIKNRKKVIALCAAFVAAGVGMNVQNAIAGYGMDQDVVSLVASGSSNSNSNGSNYLASNVSALSNSNSSAGWFDKLFNSCYMTCASMEPVQCVLEEIVSSSSSNSGVNIGIVLDGVPINLGISSGTQYDYGDKKFTLTSRNVCTRSVTTCHCDRREQTDCTGKKLGRSACE